VGNNPINATDPTGHMQESDDYLDRDGKCDSNDKGCNDLLGRINKKNKNVGLGVFGEDELLDLGIECGQHNQVACDVYTQGTTITSAQISVNYSNNPIANFVGDFVASGLCGIIEQGCLLSGTTYDALFRYKNTLGASGVDWNRYVVNQNNGELSVLFIANWDITSYNGELVAKETFPLRGGSLGSGSVLLKGSAVGNGIEWNSVGYSRGDSIINGSSVPMFISFATQPTGIPNQFTSVGTFSLGSKVLGTITITGYVGP